MDNSSLLSPLILLLLLCCFQPFCCDESVENINKTDFKKQRPLQQERALFRGLTSCALARDTVCLFDASEEYLVNKRQDLLAAADLEILKMHKGRAESGESPSQLAVTLSKIIGELTNLFHDGISSWFKGRESDEEDEIQDATEGEEGETTKTDGEKEESKGRAVSEGRKKKKKEKLKTLIKLIIIGIVLAVKFLLFLKAVGAALKVKFFLVALGGLLLNAARFYYDIKKGKEAQKVIYYEHAQHQHHYEGGDEDWEQTAPSSGHGGGGYWGRAYDEADSTAQNLAYSKQKPTHTKTDNKNAFSWF